MQGFAGNGTTYFLSRVRNLMTRELKDLIADVREQVAFLEELGVDALDARLPEAGISPIAVASMPAPTQPLRELPPQNLTVEDASQKNKCRCTSSVATLAC